MSFLRALGAAKVDIEIQIGLCWAISCLHRTCDDKDSGIVVGQSGVFGNHADPRALVDKAFFFTTIKPLNKDFIGRPPVKNAEDIIRKCNHIQLAEYDLCILFD